MIRWRLRAISTTAFFALAWLAAAAEGPQGTNDYAAVNAIFTANCLDCHAAEDPEGQLVLENFEGLMQGGEIGPAIIPGKSADSLVVQMIEGHFQKEGKTKIMPPGKRKKLSSQEIATIKSWIDAGAPAPALALSARELIVPKIQPRGRPRNPINALAWSPSLNLLALGRHGEVELRSAADLHLVRALPGHTGNVNAVAFSGDQLFAAAGQPGLGGEVRQWETTQGKLVRVIPGHKDALYSLALSPDGKILATGSYDQKIKLWRCETGEEIKTLSGHNGCVYALAFRPDGRLLASASADRTVKIWDVASGERRETLSQSQKELYTVVFSPDGKRLFAGGADNRIRVWEISENAAETTNPILHSKFAHEGAILRLAFSTDGKTLLSSADDQTVKLWEPLEMRERLSLEKQPDWPSALTFIGEGTVAVGRLDGSMKVYNALTGAAVASIEPNRDRSTSADADPGAKIKVAGADRLPDPAQPARTRSP